MIRICRHITDHGDATRPLCVTHAGVFHADEVLATAILERAFGSLDLMRVARVPADLPANAIVYDIGGGELDHHQKGGNGARADGVPYASAGLVWREYGSLALAETPDAAKVWQLVDERLVEGVDAADNGVITRDEKPAVMDLAQAVSGFNPQWTGSGDYGRAFLRAVRAMRAVLDNAIESARAELLARTEVESSLRSCEDGVLVLDCWVPWKETLAESADPRARAVEFVVYPSQRGGFNCQAVQRSGAGERSETLFPESWRGLADEELQVACGVPDATFCHNAGFIAAAESSAGAVALARRARACSRPRA